MRTKILHWLANGETGTSSETMAFKVLGIKKNNESHPHDPDDFNRCLLLIHAIPEIKNYFNEIAQISDIWKRLIEHWGELEALFISEVGWDWENGLRAEKTYYRMKEIIND